MIEHPYVTSDETLNSPRIETRLKDNIARVMLLETQVSYYVTLDIQDRYLYHVALAKTSLASYVHSREKVRNFSVLI